jgi:hypothetical protein
MNESDNQSQGEYKMRKSLTTLMLGAVGVISLVAMGCSDSDNPMSPAPVQTANVLVAHASPDAPGVDLYVDNADSAAYTNLEFPKNTGYVPLPAGTRNVKVRVNTDTTVVINADLMLDAAKNYSVFAVDSVSNIAPLVLEDDLSTPAAGKAHVRFVHLSPNADPVDVGLAGGGAKVFGPVAFKGSEGFTPLDAGTYDLEVRLSAGGAVVLTLPPTTLEAGKIYTVFAKGFVGGPAGQELGYEVIANN